MIAVNKYVSSWITALKYILDLAYKGEINPNKCIINFSYGNYEYYHPFNLIVKKMMNEGFMFVASAGNDKLNQCIKTERYLANNEIVSDMHYPSSYNKIINVGSINNNNKNSIFKSEVIKIILKKHIKKLHLVILEIV